MKFVSIPITIAIIMCCLVSISAPFLGIQFFPWIQLFPSLDLFVFLLACFFVFVPFSRSINPIIQVGTLLLSLFTLVLHTYPTSQIEQNESDFSTHIKVVSLNVNQFQNDTSRVNQIIGQLNQTQADVVVLQEFGLYYKWPDVDAVSHDFSQRTALPYFHFEPHKGNIFGTAIFSKYPIEKSELVFNLLSHTNEAWKHTLNVNGKIIEIINLHLQSFNFGNNRNSPQYQSISEVIEAQFAQSKQILKSGDPLVPRLLLGDFNCVRGSHIYELYDRGFTNAFDLKPSWLTGSLKFVPIKIDHAFFSNSIKVENAFYSPDFQSDHKAMILKLSF